MDEQHIEVVGRQPVEALLDQLLDPVGRPVGLAGQSPLLSPFARTIDMTDEP
jgi:hypothetical protein